MCLEEYIATLKGLVENNTDEAIKFLFKVYDADGKNFLTSTRSPLSLCGTYINSVRNLQRKWRVRKYRKFYIRYANKP